MSENSTPQWFSNVRSPSVYIACADGEEELAEQLAEPLREAGYSVSHHGTILVGSSSIGEAAKVMAAGAPIVLCATVRAIGSRWAHQIVHAGHKTSSVFVVVMEPEAYVEQIALQTKVARYCDDPNGAINELLGALKNSFPIEPRSTNEPTSTNSTRPQNYLDQPVPLAVLDTESVQAFRRELRPEVADQYPLALTAWEFLDRANLRVGDWLTRTGALLFSRNPSTACPTAMIKCVHYQGTTRDSSRRALITHEGTVQTQIEATRSFIARHARHDEAPTANSSRAETTFAYPMIAVREIVANAIAHRDYTSQDSCVHVRLYADRLEISSPGAWLGQTLTPKTEHDLAELNGQSIKRNYRLAHLLSWILLVEGEGSGIPTAVKDCDEANAPHPTVIQDQGFVTVTLFPNPTPRAQFIASYRQQLIRAHEYIGSPYFERRRTAPLEDLYVSPRLGKVSNGISATSISLDELRTNSHRAVILGDPGGGKTTAANAIVLRAARDMNSPIPFLVTVRDLDNRDPENRSILSYIENRISYYYQLEPTPGLIESQLSSGGATVIFDGLDELIDTSDRHEITNIIELFALRYPETQILVTSRRIGYDKAPLSPPAFEVYELSEFSNEDVSEYAHKWFAQGEYDASENQALAEVFLSEGASFSDLLKNPLMLSLMCAVYRGQRYIPENRIEIYRACSEMLLGRWDRSRRIDVPELQVHSLFEPILQHVAYQISSSDINNSRGLSRSNLIQLVAEYLHNRSFDDFERARAAAKEFVDFCNGRAWVFTDVGTTAQGEPLYAFSHRSFLEYFTALHMVRRCHSIENLTAQLLPKVSNGGWEVVAELSVQLIDQRIERGADRTLTEMLENSRFRDNEERAKILGFLARFLTVASAALSRQITNDLKLLNIASQK